MRKLFSLLIFAASGTYISGSCLHTVRDFVPDQDETTEVPRNLPALLPDIRSVDALIREINMSHENITFTLPYLNSARYQIRYQIVPPFSEAELFIPIDRARASNT